MDRSHFIKLGTSLGLALLGSKLTGCADSNGDTMNSNQSLDAAGISLKNKINNDIQAEAAATYPCIALDKKWSHVEWESFVDSLPCDTAKDFLSSDACGEPKKFTIYWKDEKSLQKAIKVKMNQVHGYSDNSKLDYHEEFLMPMADFVGLKEDFFKDKSSYELEQAILDKATADKWDRLTPAKREYFLNKTEWKVSRETIAELAIASGVGLIIALGAATYISGFAIYAGLSTALSALAAAFGATLPFWVYTSASLVLSFSIILAVVLVACLILFGVYKWLSGKSLDEKIQDNKTKLYAIIRIHSMKAAAQYKINKTILRHSFNIEGIKA